MDTVSAMDTNILAALVSAGVSLIFGIFYWFGKKIYDYRAECKKFKMYKNYAVECLERLIYYSESGKIVYDVDPSNKVEYSLDELRFELVVETGNKVKIIKPEDVNFIILAFIERRELLNKNERKTLNDIVRYMLPSIWIGNTKYQDSANNQIIFSRIIVIDKQDNQLASIKNNFLFNTLANANEEFLKDMLAKLNKKEFDKRIKRIIAKGAE